MDGDLTRDQTEKQTGVPPPSRAGHDPQVTTPKRVTGPTGGSCNSQGPPRPGCRGSPGRAVPQPLHLTSTMRAHCVPLPAPGPPRTKTTTGFMRRRRRRRCSSRTAAAGRRPWGGRRAGRERRGRGRDCDRGCDCGTAAAALSPQRESASGSRAGRGGHVGAGLAALPGLTVPAGESRGGRGAPAGPGMSVHCLPRHSPFRHGLARPSGSTPAAMATPPHRRTAYACSPPPGIFKPPARALAVGFPGSCPDWSGVSFLSAHRLGGSGRRGQVLRSDWPVWQRAGRGRRRRRGGRDAAGAAVPELEPEVSPAPLLPHGRCPAEPGAAEGGPRAGEREKRRQQSCDSVQATFGPARI